MVGVIFESLGSQMSTNKSLPSWFKDIVEDHEKASPIAPDSCCSLLDVASSVVPNEPEPSAVPSPQPDPSSASLNTAGGAFDSTVGHTMSREVGDLQSESGDGAAAEGRMGDLQSESGDGAAAEGRSGVHQRDRIGRTLLHHATMFRDTYSVRD